MVQFDDLQMANPLHQGLGHGGQARANLQHVLPSLRVNRVNNVGNNALIGQEMLAKALAR
jgi:hypothetical protein